MGSLKSSYGYLVIFFGVNQPLLVKKILFDNSLYKRMMKNFECFYLKFFLPRILDNIETCNRCKKELNPLPII